MELHNLYNNNIINTNLFLPYTHGTIFTVLAMPTFFIIDSQQKGFYPETERFIYYEILNLALSWPKLTPSSPPSPWFLPPHQPPISVLAMMPSEWIQIALKVMRRSLN